ncbi:MAG: hypothetical protein QW607_00395 [Desulfurococcaceae archaeon]
MVSIKVALFISMILFSTLLIQINYVHAQTRSTYRVLLIYIPGIPLEYLNYTNSPLFNKWNETLVIRLDSNPPYTSLYHELLLLNTSWSLARKLVLGNNVIENNEIIEPYRAIDYTFINNTWGFLTTVFINMKSIDPSIHNRTLNPYYNYTYRYFPPQLIKLEVNETGCWTGYWDLLNTSITVRYINETFKITIDGYSRDVVFNNNTLDTQHILINITNANLTVKPGLYNIKFRIVDYNETHVIVFTPGTFEQSNWLSKFYGLYVKPINPSLPIEYFKYLDVDDIEWVFNETINFYRDMVDYAYRYKEASLYVLSIPLFEEIHRALVEDYISDSIANNLTIGLIQFINYLFNETVKKLGDTYFAIYVPYVYSNNTVINNIDISELIAVEPGLYKFVGNDLANLLKILFEYNIDFNIIKHGSEYYFLVKYRNYTINNIGQIDNGYFVLYPSNRASFANILIDQRTLIGYITMFAQGIGIGFIDINDVIRKQNSRIRELSDQISSLNRTIVTLNSTLTNTQLELGRCRSDYLNISSQLRDLRNEIDTIRNREKQWMVYALSGTASIFAILIVMYLIGIRGLKKK